MLLMLHYTWACCLYSKKLILNKGCLHELEQNTCHREESYMYCTRQNNEPWTTSAALFSVSELSSQHKELETWVCSVFILHSHTLITKPTLQL